jgi:hypothetical protein
MTIEIGRGVMAAFMKEEALDQAAFFVRWWTRYSAILGMAPDLQSAAAIIGRANSLAESIGLEDEQEYDDERFDLCALFIALMPAPTARQYLLGIDVIFDDALERERVATLAMLVQDGS